MADFNFSSYCRAHWGAWLVGVTFVLLSLNVKIALDLLEKTENATLHRSIQRYCYFDETFGIMAQNIDVSIQHIDIVLWISRIGGSIILINIIFSVILFRNICNIFIVFPLCFYSFYCLAAFVCLLLDDPMRAKEWNFLEEMKTILWCPNMSPELLKPVPDILTLLAWPLWYGIPFHVLLWISSVVFFLALKQDMDLRVSQLRPVNGQLQVPPLFRFTWRHYIRAIASRIQACVESWRNEGVDNEVPQAVQVDQVNRQVQQGNRQVQQGNRQVELRIRRVERRNRRIEQLNRRYEEIGMAVMYFPQPNN